MSSIVRSSPLRRRYSAWRDAPASPQGAELVASQLFQLHYTCRHYSQIQQIGSSASKEGCGYDCRASAALLRDLDGGVVNFSL